jgi:hypothetical protein
MSAIALPTSRIERLSTTRVVLWISITIALLIHIPIYPAIWDIVEQVFDRKKDETEQADSEVPVELDLDNDTMAVKQPDQAPPPPKPDTESPAPSSEMRDAEPPKPPADANPPDAAVPPDAPPDATTPDAAPLPIASETPPDKTPSSQVEAPPNPSGNVNNVEIILVGKQLRDHPVGEKMGKLLPNLKQWQDFFANAPIDAVKDADLIVLTGPQMRVSGQVDAIILWNIPMDRVKGALDGVVQRSKGSWLDGADTPTALGKADRADRMFVMVPDKQLLYVTPPPHPQKGEKEWTPDKLAEEEKKKVDKIMKFKPPKIDVPFAILISVKEPGKLSKFELPTALGTVKLQLIPSTVEKFVFRVDPLPNGEAQARIELWDDNVKDAEEDVGTANANWGLAQVGAHLGLKIDLPDATFTTKGRLIYAETKVTKEFLDSTFDLGVVMMNQENMPHK